MSVPLLLMLLAVRSECLTVGTKVIAVFPENIAYYHPEPPQNKLRVTALHNDTRVTLDPAPQNLQPTHILVSGQVWEVIVDSDQELDKSNLTGKMTTVTSDKDIAVEIISQRNNSLQTALLLPAEQLGKQYQVPRIPETAGTGPNMTAAVTERSPFKLIIASTESNTITLPDGVSVELDANQVIQHWVYQSMVTKMVNGTKPFLVIFAHSCAIQWNCTCGALYSPLQPYNDTKLTFIAPPSLSNFAESQTHLLKPSGTARFTDGIFQENGPVMLHRPGLLMNLIPEEDFGSCFIVNTVADAAENWAVVVVPADSTADVQKGDGPAGGTWEHVPGTGNKYQYTRFQLYDSKYIFWHKSALMAVYFLGKRVSDKDAWFGNPAPCLSKDPDHRGCVLEPEITKLLPEEKSWQASIQACRSQDLDLVSLSDPIFQQQIYNWTLSLNLNLTELWMGLRRSSYSGHWYWISEAPLIHVDWSQGSPGGWDQGECARISLKDSNDPGWIHHHCCTTAKAVCYKPPKLLTF